MVSYKRKRLVKKRFSRKKYNRSMRGSGGDCPLVPDQIKVHKAKAFVISCMDFRLRDDLVNVLNQEPFCLQNNYDEFILAGACIGYNIGKSGAQDVSSLSTAVKDENLDFTKWAELVDNHIMLAHKLHKITEIIVVDHLQCGAYKHFKHTGGDIEDESASHIEEFEKFKELIKLNETVTSNNISIRFLLMDVNGKLVYDSASETDNSFRELQETTTL
jgi:hypothetical protein